MNAAAAKQLTLRLDRVLTAMAARASEDRPLGFFATVYSLPRADLQAWADEFNGGSARLTPHRLLEVKRELRILSEARSAANIPPVRSAAAAAVAGGPGAEVLPWLLKQKLNPIVAQVFQVEVTPPLAAAWLALNTGNRKPSRAKVRRFAALIAAGRWILNGETVKFSSSGRLVDGQSRLQAIIEADRPALIEVRGGLPDAAQATMDCGEPRRGTHTLEMLGEKDPLVLSPALRLVFKWHYGLLGGNSGKGRISILENQAMKPLLDEHPGLRASVAWAVAQGVKLRKLMPYSEAAFYHYVFGRASAPKRDEFFAGLCRANGMTQPVALLQQRILEAQAGRMSGGARLRLVVKAWNAHFNRQNIKELVLAPREGVPPIAGVSAKGGKAA